jgi:hypothetical protein
MCVTGRFPREAVGKARKMRGEGCTVHDHAMQTVHQGVCFPPDWPQEACMAHGLSLLRA